MWKILYLGFVAAAVLYSCNRSSDKKKEKATAVESDSSESCAPIKDPNNAKPMALMMRQMAADADSVKTHLLSGEAVDSVTYPFLRFYMVEPTDPKVLEPQFYENARMFQEAYKKIFRVKKEDQMTAYNAAIGMCINCHMAYCSGPLKRIRKLPIVLK